MFDTERLAKEAWFEFGRQYNVPVTDEIIMKCIGINGGAFHTVSCDHFGDSFDVELLRHSIGSYMRGRIDRDGMPIKKGLHTLLEFLEEHRIPAAVASSSSRAVVTDYLKRSGLSTWFMAYVSGDMVMRSKPEPDIFLKAAEMLGVKPEDCVILEDSANGIRAAAAAGAKPIMVPDLIPPNEELTSLSYRIVPELAEVIPILEELLTEAE